MARRKKRQESSAGGEGWMVTFSDLMTLLLTFFVLLLSMSSMDQVVIKETLSSFRNDIAFLTAKGAGRVPTRFELLAKMLERPLEALDKPQRIKDLLFPDEVLPQWMSRQRLEENLLVLERPEGVALVLTDGLLFAPGSSELDEGGRVLLGQIAAFLASTPLPVNVAGYGSDEAGADPAAVARGRALRVLEFFLGFGFEPDRFSVSAYTAEAAALPGVDPTRWRRVEILFKTMGRTYL
jgi:chemotaxis protein MotB